MAATSQVESHLDPHLKSLFWSPAKRIGFRFVFLYFVLYNFPFPIGWIPGTDGIYQLYSSMWHAIIPWIARHVFNLRPSITVFTNGSGDTRYDYLLALCFLVLALVGTPIWSVLDHRRTEYETLHVWLRAGMRLLLAGTMMLFGSVKVFQVQFPVVTLSKMLETYGDSSPMGLLWTFMGASPAYATFTGIVEMVAGVLLIFPRVTTLGALISMAAMGNVFVLNLAYDVPVKLYSCHVLLMAMILIVPEMRRLADVFFFNRQAAPATYPPLFVRRGPMLAFIIFQFAFGLYIFSNALYQAYKVDGRLAPKPPHYGIWMVDQFAVNGQLRPPLLTDRVRWHRVVFDDFDSVAVEPMIGPWQRLAKESGSDNSFSLLKTTKESGVTKLYLQQPTTDTIMLEGEMDGQQVRVKLHKTEGKFLLMTRGFHWVSEQPFNR